MNNRLFDPLPQSFTAAISALKAIALQEFAQEAAQKQLYYHNPNHARAVQRQARRIFQVVQPYLVKDELIEGSVTRTAEILDLCAIAHDMVQIFQPQTDPHRSRQRDIGVSELATIDKLLRYVETLNQHVQAHDLDPDVCLTAKEQQVIRIAIEATICAYDETEQAIYQPALDDPELPPMARILALADIGTLGLEGIAPYNREGSLIFLEDNPDIIPLLIRQQHLTLAADHPTLAEDLRQRLLQRSRFQVNFATSRLNRFQQELKGLPPAAHTELINSVFTHLTPDTIQAIAQSTPTAFHTSLADLVKFFNLETTVLQQSVWN